MKAGLHAAGVGRIAAAVLSLLLSATGCGGGGSGGEQTTGTAGGLEEVRPAPTAPVASAPADGTRPPSEKTTSVTVDESKTASPAFLVHPILTAPQNDATDVPASAHVVVAYENDINPDGETLAALAEENGNVDGSLTVEGRSIVFMPSKNLRPATSYTFYLDTEVASEKGVFQRTSLTLRFRTAAAS